MIKIEKKRKTVKSNENVEKKGKVKKNKHEKIEKMIKKKHKKIGQMEKNNSKSNIQSNQETVQRQLIR